MTIDRVAMQELLEKGSDQDLLREMIAFVLSEVMSVLINADDGDFNAVYGRKLAALTAQTSCAQSDEGTDP